MARKQFLLACIGGSSPHRLRTHSLVTTPLQTPTAAPNLLNFLLAPLSLSFLLFISIKFECDLPLVSCITASRRAYVCACVHFTYVLAFRFSGQRVLHSARISERISWSVDDPASGNPGGSSAQVPQVYRASGGDRPACSRLPPPHRFLSCPPLPPLGAKGKVVCPDLSWNHSGPYVGIRSCVLPILRRKNCFGPTILNWVYHNDCLKLRLGAGEIAKVQWRRRRNAIRDRVELNLKGTGENQRSFL